MLVDRERLIMSPDATELLSLVRARCSTRSFTGEHVSDEDIATILKIAAYAPSSWGGHPMEYIVVRDKAVMRELARCKAMGAGPTAYSDAVIVPIIDKDGLELWIEDASVASTYILLAAEACAVGACWIHIRDRRGHTGTAEEDIRKVLGLPDKYGILNLVALGVKANDCKPKTLSPKIKAVIG